MHRRHVELIFVATLAIAAVVAVLLEAGGVVGRGTLGMALVLVLPGYGVASIIYDGRWTETVERIALTLGLSLAIAVLAGLVLNWTPWGLRPSSWSVTLGGITLAACMAAMATGRTPCVASEGPFRVCMPIRSMVILGLAVLVAAAAIGLASTEAARQRGEGFTQLWLLPDVDADGKGLHLGVRSVEAATIEYRLFLKVRGSTVFEKSSLMLAPGEEWKVRVTLPAGLPEGAVAEALLYRSADLDVPYRRVTLWLTAHRTQGSTRFVSQIGGYA